MSMDNKELGRGSLMTPRLIVGLAIALFGVVLVLDRLNLVVADQVLRWWPAVIVPIGKLMAPDLEIVHAGPESEELALSLREELTGIQYGRVEDRYGWMTRLDA